MVSFKDRSGDGIRGCVIKMTGLRNWRKRRRRWKRKMIPRTRWWFLYHTFCASQIRQNCLNPTYNMGSPQLKIECYVQNTISYQCFSLFISVVANIMNQAYGCFCLHKKETPKDIWVTKSTFINRGITRVSKGILRGTAGCLGEILKKCPPNVTPSDKRRLR